MLLNHYKAFLEQYMQGKVASFVGADGKTYTFANLSTQNKKVLLPLPLHQTGTIYFGRDNTPETGESYGLKNEMSPTLISTSLTKSVVDNDDGSHSSVVTATITNVSSASVTIGEIGLLESVTYSNNTTQVVFDRTPLGTPLTIQPGEVGRIVYTITMA